MTSLISCFDVSESPARAWLFSFCVEKQKNKKKKRTNEQGRVSFALPVRLRCVCCDDPLVASFSPYFKFWRLLHLKLFGVSDDRVPSTTTRTHTQPTHNQCIYSGAAIDRRVRQSGERRADIGVQSSAAGSLAAQKMKCRADDSHCQNRNSLVEHLKLSRLESTRVLVTKKKRVFWKSLFLFLTDSVHYFQPNTFSVLYKQQGL